MENSHRISECLLQSPVHFVWLNHRFYNHGVDSIDSNFRHMKKNISSDKADPGLGIDLAYFVENKVYKEYVRKHSNEPEQVS